MNEKEKRLNFKRIFFWLSLAQYFLAKLGFFINGARERGREFFFENGPSGSMDRDTSLSIIVQTTLACRRISARHSRGLGAKCGNRTALFLNGALFSRVWQLQIEPARSRARNSSSGTFTLFLRRSFQRLHNFLKYFNNYAIVDTSYFIVILASSS